MSGKTTPYMTLLVLAGAVLGLLAVAVIYWDGPLFPWTPLVLGLVLALVVWRLQPDPMRSVAQALDSEGVEQAVRDLANDPGGQSEALVRKRLAALALESAEQADFLVRAVSAAPSPVFVCDSSGHVALASEGLGLLLGIVVEDCIGREAHLALPVDRIQDAVGHVLAGNGLWRETLYVHLDHRSFSAEVSAAPVHNSQGEILGVSCALMDLSGVDQEREALAEQQAQMKSSGNAISLLAGQVASATEELSAAADEQARSSQEQKGQSQAVATAMEQMAATVVEVAGQASATSDEAGSVQTAAGEGVALVDKVVSGIHSVAESAQGLAVNLTQLDAQADEIGRIISVINEIADQTNLLALNAAIEAARAGDAGRGFAVVADEVRKLAEKTMTATQEVESAVEKIQQGARVAVDSMEETKERVEQGTALANQTGEALQGIMDSIKDMVQRITQIATAAEEQSAATDEVKRNMETIAQIATETDEGLQQSAHATRDLARLSQELLGSARELAGKDASPDMLEVSGPTMRGVLPAIMQDYIMEEFEPEVGQAVMAALGDPVFLPTSEYPNDILHRLARETAEQTSTTPREVFLGFGRFTVPRFHSMYRHYFRSQDAKEMLLAMDDIHAQLTRDYPGILPPSFTYENKGNVLVMTYHSQRGLFDYFEGVINGLAEFLGSELSVTVEPLDDERARAEIMFAGVLAKES
ncbi:MAG: PAS domain-containing protein [Desulfovibrio sp.]|nr:MAG: PAS domain-containing protein [Desulfovibrio sp.]